MKKGNSWVHFIIEGVLIAVSITSLVIFRQLIYRAKDIAGLNHQTNIILAILISCFVLIFVTQALFTKKDSWNLRRERDEDLLKLKAKAQTDALTNLLNREAAIEQITQFLEAEGHNHCHTLLIIDLDNFKSINDNFGHFEGDMVLKILSAKIKSVFRNIDIVGRLGGDEFIVLMKYTATKTIVSRKALELKTALEYIASGGVLSITVTGSIGISTYDGNGKSFEALYKEADEALYKAKLGGKNRYCCYKESEADAYEGSANSKTALTESSAFIQLQALIDNIDGGIALLEIGDQIRAIFLSQSYNKLMHVSTNNIKQADNRVFDFIHKDDIKQVEEVMRQGAVSGKSVEAVFRRLTESGDTKWYHIRAVRIQYENSAKPVLIAIVTDVTNLKETALNFQAQKKQLETVLRISRVVTFEVDIARRTLYVTNPTIAKYGIDVSAIENMPESLIEGGAIHPDSFEECRRMYDEIYAGVPEGSAIVRTLKRDGTFTIERFTYFTVFDESGCPVKAVGVDEGMETRSETKLRVDLIERQFRNNSDSMLTIVKVMVAMDSFEFLKPENIPDEAMQNIKRYSDLLEYRLKQAAEQADRHKILERFSIDSLKDDLAEGAKKSIEYRILTDDGSVRWLSMSAGVFFDQFDGGRYAFIRTHDATFRKNLEISMNEKITREPDGFLYSFDNLKKLSNAYIRSEERTTDCAVVVLSISNYGYLLEQYGQIMVNDMLGGFIGKIMTIICADILACYVGDGVIAALIADVQSITELRQMMEKIMRFLKNPVYFQFHEEVFMEFSCGISCSDEKKEGFEELYDEALRVMNTLGGNTDTHIAISPRI
jgi:diguanylate cyclase (GGDEF)-like protein/PAS domain S-box-containing protein